MNINKLYICLILLVIFIFPNLLSQNIKDLKFEADYRNDVRSQNKLGLCYENGEGVDKDIETAEYWYKKAANNGYEYAQYNLGKLYYYGNFGQNKKDEGIKWFFKAAKNHHPYTNLLLGKFYLKGEYFDQNYSKAIKYFKDGAFLGNSEAMHYLGYCHAKGIGTPQDSIKALIWFDRAIDNNFQFSNYWKGYMYEHGLAVSPNIDKAVEYYYEGAQKNDSDCQYSMALCYANGKGVSVDQDKAKYYLEASANQNNKFAQRLIGQYLLNGIIYDENIPQSIVWLTKAAENNDGISCNLLCSIYNKKGDTNLLFKYAMKGAELRNTNCLNRLAYCYAQGLGTKKNFEKALESIDSAILISPNEPNYYDSKGEIYLIKKDLKKAKQLWEQVKSMFPQFYIDFPQSNLNKYFLTH